MAELKTFRLTIARVDQALFEGQVRSASVPGIAGAMEVLAGHESFITPLAAGEVVITNEEGKQDSFTIEGGTMEVHQNHMTVLV